MVLHRLPLTLLKNAAGTFCREMSQRLEPLFRAAEKTPDSRYYLSARGERSVGPFPMTEVKWMIRCRHFPPDVLIRPENESLWVSYRHHTSQAIVGRALSGIVTQVRRIQVYVSAWRSKSAETLPNS
ncbi:MAG: hypothetical protein DME86_10895 [Verrucomicrobia bacterium]|nr:MAG: hypothetical protein DME86_10895 [Verrucomicrobiota bacterium]